MLMLSVFLLRLCSRSRLQMYVMSSPGLEAEGAAAFPDASSRHKVEEF